MRYVCKALGSALVSACVLLAGCGVSINKQSADSGRNSSAGLVTWHGSILDQLTNLKSFSFDPADPGAVTAGTSYLYKNSFVHEYATNKYVIVDARVGEKVFLRFAHLGNANQLIVDRVKEVPSLAVVGEVVRYGMNVAHFHGSHRLAFAGLFQPVAGAANDTVSIVRYDPATYDVTVVAYTANAGSEEIVFLNADDSRLVTLEQDNSGSYQRIKYRVFNSSDLSVPLATGVLDPLAAEFPGPAYGGANFPLFDRNRVVNISGNDFVFFGTVAANDGISPDAYQSPIVAHLRIQGDATVVLGNFTKDLFKDSDLGVLQFSPNTAIRTGLKNTFALMGADRFAVAAELGLKSLTSLGGSPLAITEPVLVIGKINPDFSFALGQARVLEQHVESSSPTVFVSRGTQELIVLYERSANLNRRFAREPTASVSLQPFLYQAQNKYYIDQGPGYLVNTVGDLPAVPGDPRALMAVATNGLSYAWNSTLSQYDQMDRLRLEDFEAGGAYWIGFPASDWSVAAAFVPYDPVNLSLGTSGVKVLGSKTKDWRQAPDDVWDIWDFGGVMSSDERKVIVFTDSDGYLDLKFGKSVPAFVLHR